MRPGGQAPSILKQGSHRPAAAGRGRTGPIGLPRTSWSLEAAPGRHWEAQGRRGQRKGQDSAGSHSRFPGHRPLGLLLPLAKSPGPECCPDAPLHPGPEPQQALLAWLPGCPTTGSPTVGPISASHSWRVPGWGWRGTETRPLSTEHLPRPLQVSTCAVWPHWSQERWEGVWKEIILEAHEKGERRHGRPGTTGGPAYPEGTQVTQRGLLGCQHVLPCSLLLVCKWAE